jgi:hypothetical protein
MLDFGVLSPNAVRPMTLADRLAQPRYAKTAHPEELLSILISLIGTAVATGFIWSSPGFEPANGPAWAIPAWLALFYLLVQLVFLLVSATQIRALGVLDSIIAIVPVIAGAVMTVEWILGHLSLSAFQINALAALFVAGIAEFLLTIWIRFVLNRRTFAFGSGTT